MNLRPIFTQGSIEFRTMGARPEPKQIIQWAHLTHHLKRFACERYANPCLIANDLSERGGRSILIDICSRDKTWMGDELAAEFFRAPSNEDFDRKCLEGFRRAQYVINGFPWYEWMPEIEKVYVPNPFSESKKKAKSTYEINRIEDFDVAVAPREGPRFRIRPVLEDDEVEPEPDVEEWIAGDEPQDNPPREPPQAPREGEWRDPLAPEERLHRAMNEDAARLANNRGRINDLNWELLNRRRGVRALGDF